ncbi:ATP-binding protein [Lutimaribacter sp. EGI FJ00015]|uniref:ATP-binding protein n=1 Tax=Lutimaribacter degradans TaxID=2945989 RepID=A0ACC5ZWN3_9RHOB|nr:ATP-binding protein [Lutimaribacter sp. EGI FJ00013]MCM2562265.1 ATP-binding protein [Lutimaribacter sp. EGI FJ00013]MCO0613420.1 ATP-binding protein [Lutimaribacter sp. EGI FJ00015]MCO0636394.1 ATP-binding protein [Lutimaribacter sp. EGI FJ00014]
MAKFWSRVWRGRRGWVPMSGLIVGISLFLVLGAQLAWRGVAEMRALDQPYNDNVIWTVAQAEVEFLTLQRTILAVETGMARPADLRRAFNVFYSRLTTLREGPSYRAYLDAVDAAETLQALALRMEAHFARIDGPDAVLIAAAPAIRESLTPMNAALRGVSAGVLQVMVRERQEARTEVFGVLRDLALVAAILMVLMAVLSLVLWRLFVVARSRARALQQTSARLSTIVTTSRDAIVVTDGENRISEFNHAATALFGVPRRAVMGQPITRLVDVSGLDGAERRRVTGRRGDGGEVPLEVTRGAVHSDEGCVQVFVFRDISARMEIEQTLRSSRDEALAGERAKARFIAVMSHEMRTPLNGILGIVELLRGEARRHDDSRLKEYLDILEQSGEILLGHVNDVLEFTDLDTPGLRLAEEPVNLEDLSHAVMRGFAPAARRRGIKLERVVSLPGAGVVLGDPVRLRQVMTNLVDNALKNTTEGRVSLEISATAPGVAAPLVEIQVSDTGVGIAPDQQDRIFEDFVRLDPPDGVTREGTGLGLGIARRLVEAMGGEIGVESEPGEGSLFWVRLPLRVVMTEQASPHDDQPDREALVAPKLVLVVEDNAINRFLLREMLETDGHKVDTADNGAQGVEAARAVRYDLIVMDIAMPVMDGDDAARQIRNGGGPNAHTRIVGLTAHIKAAEAQPDDSCVFDQVLIKPLTWAALRALVEGRKPAPADLTQQRAPLLDPTALAALEGRLKPDARRALVDGLLCEGDALMDQIESGTAESEDLRRQVHSLAGAAAVLGARRLHLQLGEIETGLARGAPAPDMGSLGPLWRDTRAALERSLTAFDA